MKFREIIHDLFETDYSYALAHCISADCIGMAKEFMRKKHFHKPTYDSFTSAIVGLK